MTELTLRPTAPAKRSRPVLTALIVLTGVFLSSLDLFIVNIAFRASRRASTGRT